MTRWSTRYRRRNPGTGSHELFTSHLKINLFVPMNCFTANHITRTVFFSKKKKMISLQVEMIREYEWLHPWVKDSIYILD